MQLGITLWGFGLGYREAVDLARRAEDAGFHNLFMVEGVLSNDGVITADNFRDFTFANAVHLWGTQNPRFFEGTAVARAAAEELSRPRAYPTPR